MHYTSVLILFLIYPVISVFAQKPDTLQADLGEIEVTAYESNRSLMEVPASISFVSSDMISAFDNSSLLYGMNMVPGLRMEQRAPGSYRIAIRGSSLRSPFGIRNVKIYWNNIPFTEPSGNTFLNLLDMINMQEAEVIRGPAGSVYGAGNGGVILFNSYENGDMTEIGTTIGSFGQLRYSLQSSAEQESGSLIFKFAHQQSDGYREQSFLNRETVELSGDFDLNERQSVQTSFLYSDLYYGIPGGLTLEQMQENPQQARPGNAFTLGSLEADASIKHQAFLAGLTHAIDFNKTIENKTTVFGSFSHFDHPFNLDYKLDSRKSGGVRSIFSLNRELWNAPFQINAGGEYQVSQYAARNYENNFGSPGALNFDDQIGIKSELLFLAATIDLPRQYYVSGGFSLNRLHYSLNRLVSNLPGDVEGMVEKQFNPEIIPKIGLVKKFSSAAALYGSLSYGFSPPTIEEFRTNEGSINTDLKPEQGMSYELGVRGFLRKGKISYDVTTFYFKLDESIVQRQSDRGTVIFENAGNTDQLGLEFAMQWMIIEDRQDILKQLQWNISYTYNYFLFGDYMRDDVDYSRNKIPGVAPHTFVSLVQAQLQSGLYSSISFNVTDEIPLNDANTVYANSYHLLQGKIGYRFEMLPNINLDLHVGADNILNEAYSLGNDLNAFGARYYQPASPGNWFVGIKLVFSI